MTITLQHGNSTPTHAIIWLHGLGASAQDFPPVVPHLGLSSEPSIVFVFPQAPNRPITINGGYVMPGWYDIAGISIEQKQDRGGVEESRTTIEALIAEQIDNGIPAENIILAGFSQGGAVAYYTALRSEHKLAGALALSTYLVFAEESESEQSNKNKDTPFFVTHGSMDDVVPLTLGKESAQTLQGLGYNVEWKQYTMAHEVSMEQIRDIGAWINTVFGGSG